MCSTVGQTEGAELPELGSTFAGNVGDKLNKLAEFTTGQGIKLEYSDKIAPARGMSYGGLIRILPNMEPSETLATFVHELAHEMLHRAERRTLTTKTVRETEAVAFVVCHALGLETGTGSSDYVVFAVMLCRSRKAAVSFTFPAFEHNITGETRPSFRLH
jgi:hypothetical protein